MKFSKQTRRLNFLSPRYISNYISIGIYFYNKEVFKYFKKIKPSKRGELEITDINNLYLKSNQANISFLSRGISWFDIGRAERFVEASAFIRSIENYQGLKIGCPEEILYRMGLVDKKTLIKQIKNYGKECEDLNSNNAPTPYQFTSDTN